MSNDSQLKVPQDSNSIPARQEIPAGWTRDDSTGKLRPIKGEVLITEEPIKCEGSLQDRFNKFRREKLKAVESHLNQAKLDNESRRTPLRMQELRSRFIERCKSYYGVPYAKRYHEPDSPLHQSPLFLDCCGLVRQVLRDLKDEFGFTIGPWNQAYMCDPRPPTHRARRHPTRQPIP
jgi:hypothetical protein